MKILSSNPPKAWAEQLFLVWGFVWVACFGLIVATGVYHHCGDVGYMLIGLFVSVPYVLLPLWLEPALHTSGFRIDTFGQWCSARYWVKANAWIAIFSYVGNYFWTHYFYHVLGASYSFPVAIHLNGVPFFLYLITHAYFCFYHSLTNMTIRACRQTACYRGSGPVARLLINVAVVFALAVFTAFMETWTIQSVPYCSHHDKWSMYTVGSVFYGIYFFASFPMFFRLDEPTEHQQPTNWSISQTIIDSLAACMIVTIFLDLWRLVVCAWAPSLVANVAVCAHLPTLLIS